MKYEKNETTTANTGLLTTSILRLRHWWSAGVYVDEKKQNYIQFNP